MRKYLTYISFNLSFLVILLSIFACEREPAVDHLEDTDWNEPVFQSNAIQLDSLVLTNPVFSNGQIRFDLLGTPPQIKVGDIIYFPGGEGISGRVLSAAVLGSRMVFQLDKPRLDLVFKTISMLDTVSDSHLKSRFRIIEDSWHLDTLALEGFNLFDDFWQTKRLKAGFVNGHLYSTASLGQFFISGQGFEPWFDRFRLDLNYSMDISGEFMVQAGSAADASDSVLIEKAIYGPFWIKGFPVTYQIDTWLGFHAITERDTVLVVKFSGHTEGNLSAGFNYWETWKFVQNNKSQWSDIKLFSGPRLSSYQNEVFVRQVIRPIFCGEESASLTNSFSVNASSEVAIPIWNANQSARTEGVLSRKGAVFGEFVPARLGTAETLLYSEAQNGLLENQPPKASFVINPPAGFTDTNFEFDASNSSDLESPSSTLIYRWDFDGDNHYDTDFSSQSVVFRKFALPGLYQTILEVKDPDGLTSRKVSAVEVSLSSLAPIAFFTVTPESGRITDVFLFDASESFDSHDPLSLLKVRWDFDSDGIWDQPWNSKVKSAIYVYPEPGRYIAKLEVLNTLGLLGSTTHIVNVAANNIKPTAIFTVNPSAGTTETIFGFDASASTDPEDPKDSLQVKWDWNGDGIYDTGFSTVKTIQHIFPTAGVYTVVIEVIDTEGYGSTYSVEIKVSKPNTKPDADFRITPDTGTVDTEFTFDASVCTDAEDSLDQLEVQWDWNNDNIFETEYSREKIFKRKFSVPGTYIIKVQVRDSGGLTDTKAWLLVVN